MAFLKGLTMLLVGLSLGAALAGESGTAIRPPGVPACGGAGCNASAVLPGGDRSFGPEHAAAGGDRADARAAGSPQVARSPAGFLAKDEDCAHPCTWLIKGCDPNRVCTLGCCLIVR
uniref:WAP domain-containing protein n=1 Tax=Zooxanthella nutricula TaxID=1333877 RepID=A0A6V0DZG6_9DINO|mmetsp:Transcript_96977/g.296409  ORF Transcript_96977/g.296409 Transcript_96977/m.296409 type:complete len:117 (+) Transcript_96977:151-501(+)